MYMCIGVTHWSVHIPFVEDIYSKSVIYFSVLAVLPWALESWAEYDIKVFAKEGDLEKYANSEHALCVLNHRGDLDWMIGWVLIERMGMLGVSVVIYPRHMRSWVPVIVFCEVKLPY